MYWIVCNLVMIYILIRLRGVFWCIGDIFYAVLPSVRGVLCDILLSPIVSRSSLHRDQTLQDGHYKKLFTTGLHAQR